MTAALWKTVQEQMERIDKLLAGCGIARVVVQMLIQKCKPSQYFCLFDDVFWGSRILSFLKPNLPKPKRQRKIRRRFCPGHLLRCGMRQRHGNKYTCKLPTCITLAPCDMQLYVRSTEKRKSMKSMTML